MGWKIIIDNQKIVYSDGTREEALKQINANAEIFTFVKTDTEKKQVCETCFYFDKDHFDICDKHKKKVSIIDHCQSWLEN